MTTKDEVKALWKLCFNDSEEFTDLYFNSRYKDEINMAVCEDGKIISALQMIPYPMTFCREIISTSYISGACTHPEYREHGAMRRLLKETHRRMYEEGVLLGTLIPAEEWLWGYYAKSGYAPGFGYTLEKVRVDELRPSCDYQVEICSSSDAEHYHYFDTQIRKRKSCILHSEEDFEVIMADLKLGDGKLLIAYKRDKVAGIAFAVQDGDELYIKELLADDDMAKATLLYQAAHIYNVSSMNCIVPSSAGTVFLGMARVIHAEKILGLFAKEYPNAELYIQIQGDEVIPENNGYYTVKDGICFREQVPGKKYQVYTISGFTRLLLEAEHPYMSLMLN